MPPPRLRLEDRPPSAGGTPSILTTADLAGIDDEEDDFALYDEAGLPSDVAPQAEEAPEPAAPAVEAEPPLRLVSEDEDLSIVAPDALPSVEEPEEETVDLGAFEDEMMPAPAPTPAPDIDEIEGVEADRPLYEPPRPTLVTVEAQSASHPSRPIDFPHERIRGDRHGAPDALVRGDRHGTMNLALPSSPDEEEAEEEAADRDAVDAILRDFQATANEDEPPAKANGGRRPATRKKKPKAFTPLSPDVADTEGWPETLLELTGGADRKG